jgi:single-strand DNA-binding protein
VSRSLNKVTLIGNLGADPEVRTTANGGKVATLSLATSRKWKKDGADQEKTEWHRVILWDNAKGAKLADLAESYMKKGDKVYIEGQIEYRSYEKDGQTRYITEIVAREVILLGGKDEVRQLAAAAAPKGRDADFDRKPEVLDDDDDGLPF